MFFRTVALELANQEEEELLSVIKDIKGFLKRPDGIPSYVAKEQLFTELTHILKTGSVKPEKKAEAIDISWLLLKLISRRNRKRSQQNSFKVVSSSLDVLLPAVICQWASADTTVKQSSVKLVQQCLQHQDNGTMIQDTLDHIAANGVSHKSDQISLETMKLLPGIYLQELDVSAIDFSFVIYRLLYRLICTCT